MDKKFFPHLLLRGILEGSLQLSLCSFINIKNVTDFCLTFIHPFQASFRNLTEIASFISSLAIILCLTWMMLFNSTHIVKKVTSHGKYPTFKSFYGELSKKYLALHFSTVFILHRMCMSAIMVFQKDFPTFQVMTIILL